MCSRSSIDFCGWFTRYIVLANDYVKIYNFTTYQTHSLLIDHFQTQLCQQGTSKDTLHYYLATGLWERPTTYMESVRVLRCIK